MNHRVNSEVVLGQLNGSIVKPKMKNNITDIEEFVREIKNFLEKYRQN